MKLRHIALILALSSSSLGCATGPFVTDVWPQPDGSISVNKCKVRVFTLFLTFIGSTNCETENRKVRK